MFDDVYLLEPLLSCSYRKEGSTVTKPIIQSRMFVIKFSYRIFRFIVY